MIGRVLAAAIAISLVAAATDPPQARDTGTRPATSTAAPAGTAVLTGTIVTDDGKPVRRAAVRLGGSDVPGGRISVTDDAGRFAFTGLPAGSFTISATKAAYVTTYYGSTRPGRGPSLPVALAAGQRLSVSMTMLRGAAIAGTITDQFGHPAPGVTVQVSAPGAPIAAAPRVAEAASPFATTDDRGMFRIYGLAPGDYIVSATPHVGAGGDAHEMTDNEVQWALQQLSPGMRPGAGTTFGPAPSLPPAGRPVAFAPVFFPGTVDPENASKITLAAGEDRGGLAFALQFVATARIDGTVAGPGGQPASSVSLTLLPKSAGSAPSLDALVTGGIATRCLVSPDGHFSAAGVTPGRYALVARTGDVIVRGIGPTSGTLWGETDVDVNGRDLANVPVTLQRGASVAGRLAFEGAAVSPPPDFSVARLAMSAARYGAASVMGTPTATVTPAGAFVFPSLMSGTYSIKVTPPPASAGAPRWALKSIVMGGRDITDSTLELRAGTDVSGVVVTFTDKETEISGTLTDSAGHPTREFSIVAFATDRAFWTPGSRRVQSVHPATDGTFRIAGLPAGDYGMAAVADLDPDWLSDPNVLNQLLVVSIKLTLADGEKKKQDLRVLAR